MSTINAANRKWFAVTRLVCYFWILVLLRVVNHYEPDYCYMVEPAINVVFLAIGGCLGRNYRLFRADRQIRR